MPLQKVGFVQSSTAQERTKILLGERGSFQDGGEFFFGSPTWGRFIVDILRIDLENDGGSG